MKLSEAIVEMQKLLDEHGDCDLLKQDEDSGQLNDIYGFLFEEWTETDVEENELNDFEVGYKYVSI